MRGMRRRLLVLALVGATGPALSFSPPFAPAWGRRGGTVGTTITSGAISVAGLGRRCRHRSCRSGCLPRTAIESEGDYVLPTEDGTDEPGIGRGRGSDGRSRWARGQGGWTKPAKRGSRVSKGGDAVALMHATTEEGAELTKDEPTKDEGRVEPVTATREGEAKDEDKGPVLTRKRVKRYFQRDFDNSSWTVAIQWRNKPYEVVTTKVFLKDDGSVVWLNKAKGEWKIRPKTRNISIYRNFLWNWNGMRIFSAKLLENTCDMYLEGEIKGWTPLSPLTVMGWFQAVRRGIVVDENTPRPPWEDSSVPTQEDPRRPRPKELIVPVDLD